MWVESQLLCGARSHLGGMRSEEFRDGLSDGTAIGYLLDIRVSFNEDSEDSGVRVSPYRRPVTGFQGDRHPFTWDAVQGESGCTLQGYCFCVGVSVVQCWNIHFIERCLLLVLDLESFYFAFLSNEAVYITSVGGAQGGLIVVFVEEHFYLLAQLLLDRPCGRDFTYWDISGNGGST